MANPAKLMDNEVLMAFASYATIILSKMMFMSIATAFFRVTKKVSGLLEVALWQTVSVFFFFLT